MGRREAPCPRSPKTRHHAEQGNAIRANSGRSEVSGGRSCSGTGRRETHHEPLQLVHEQPAQAIRADYREGRIQTLAEPDQESQVVSCENDWLTANEAPAHVIAAWIGHDIEVQTSSYAIVSDGHFEQFNARPQVASKSGTPGGTEPLRTEENASELSVPPKSTPDDKTRFTNKKARSEDRAECSGEDSNLHGVTPTCPSSMRVYQFHHQSNQFP